MDYPPHIQNLVEKYWDAETSVAEESELQNYFLLHPEHADQNAAYFLFLKTEREIEAPELQSIPVRRIQPAFKRWASIAAAVAIFAMAGLFVQKQFAPEVLPAESYVDSYQTPEQAYAEAKQALLLISEKLSSTQSKASEHIKKVQPYTDILK